MEFGVVVYDTYDSKVDLRLIAKVWMLRTVVCSKQAHARME
jgi:hypothetical protein